MGTSMSDPTFPGPAFPGIVIDDVTIPARAGWSRHVARGDHLRIIDLEGRQAVDFLCFGAEPHEGQVERYHMPNTIKVPRRLTIGRGSVLLSQFARPMMEVVEDTCGGHDTIFGCCSQAVDRVRYGRANDASCQGNFEAELARHGLGPEHVVANVNWFMNVPVGADGGVEIAEGTSRPGDFVDLRARMDVLAVASNCPQELNAAAGGQPTPVRAIVWRPDGPVER